MPNYRFVFDTTRGKLDHRFAVEEQETLGEVLPGIVDEMRAGNGGVLLRGDGTPQAIHSGRNILVFSKTLMDQGVMPEDELLITCIHKNG